MKSELFELLPDMVLFVAVGQAKSFSRAAQTLGMPVSTLSRRMALFEARLGTSLLARSTRRVELTETGQRYFEQCKGLVAAAEQIQAELEGKNAAPRGLLRISATQDFALAYLTPILAEFSSRYPDVSFDLDLTARSVDLIGEGFDVALRMGRLPDSQLFARKVGVGAIGLFASPAYLKAMPSLKHPSDLASHSCLRILGPLAVPVRWTLTRNGQVETVQVNGRFVANSMRFLAELAERGFGIAALDVTVATGGKVVRVLPGWTLPPVPVHALTRSKILPVTARVFLECVRSHLKMTNDASAT